MKLGFLLPNSILRKKPAMSLLPQPLINIPIIGIGAGVGWIGKDKMIVRQVSTRGGAVYCEYLGDRYSFIRNNLLRAILNFNPTGNTILSISAYYYQ